MYNKLYTSIELNLCTVSLLLISKVTCCTRLESGIYLKSIRNTGKRKVAIRLLEISIVIVALVGRCGRTHIYCTCSKIAIGNSKTKIF